MLLRKIEINYRNFIKLEKTNPVKFSDLSYSARSGGVVRVAVVPVSVARLQVAALPRATIQPTALPRCLAHARSSRHATRQAGRGRQTRQHHCK